MPAQAASIPAPAAPPAVLAGLPLWLAGLLLAAANFVAVLDMSIANVSVPDIAGALGASTSQGTWVITSYAVAEAITVPLTGWLAGRFGAVRVFAVALTGFGLFSALCGMAPSLGALVTFRVFQGLAGGPIMALSQTLILTIFPKKSQGAAMGMWAVTTLVAPVLGPILGGVLCDGLGWEAIFWVNVPIALACAAMIWRMLRRHDTPTVKTRVDSVGLGLLVVWVGSLQVMLDLGKDRDWFASPLIVTLAVVAAIGFAAFLIWELTEKNPIVSLKIFRHRGFSVAMLTLSLAFGSIFATNVLTPLWLQGYMGYTATWAGLVAGMIGVLAIFSAPVVAKLAEKIDPRRIVFTGIVWLALITFMRSGFTSSMSYGQMAMWMLVMGAGLPMFFLPLTGLALGSVNPEETASAAGLMNFIRTLSGALATSLVTTAWENGSSRNQADLVGTLHGVSGVMDSLVAGGLSAGQALGQVAQMVQGQAVMLATDQILLAASGVFLFAAAAIWLAPKPTRAADVSAAH